MPSRRRRNRARPDMVGRPDGLVTLASPQAIRQVEEVAPQSMRPHMKEEDAAVLWQSATSGDSNDEMCQPLCHLSPRHCRLVRHATSPSRRRH